MMHSARPSGLRTHGDGACMPAHKHPLLKRFKLHILFISVLTLLLLVAAPFKYNSFLDHQRHAREELTRKTNLWERNCKHAHTRVDAEGEIDCDELKCFVSKTAYNIALGRTLAELDVVGRLLSPATWNYITSNLGMFSLAHLTHLKAMSMRMHLAIQQRRDNSENTLLTHSTSYDYGKGGKAM